MSKAQEWSNSEGLLKGTGQVGLNLNVLYLGIEVIRLLYTPSAYPCTVFSSFSNLFFH